MSPLCQSSGGDDSPQMFSGFSRLIPQCRGCSRLTYTTVGYCPFACEKHMNPDFHACPQCDGCQNQGAMKVDDERFAFACQRLAHTKRLDPNLKANPRAPSRFTINRLGGHPPPTPPKRNTYGSEGNGYISAALCL